MRYISALLLLIISSAGAFAGADGMLVRRAQVPTIGEWGMIGMVAALGVIGFFALRKRLQHAKQQ